MLLGHFSAIGKYLLHGEIYTGASIYMAFQGRIGHRNGVRLQEKIFTPKDGLDKYVTLKSMCSRPGYDPIRFRRTTCNLPETRELGNTKDGNEGSTLRTGGHGQGRF